MLLLAVTLFIWMMVAASSHNVTSETHLCFGVAVLFLGFLLFLIKISK